MKTVNPKKKFGQNFLKDISIANQIVSLISVEKTKTIIEVGPGMGILTREILKIDKINKKFIELDIECCDYLLNNFSEIKKDLINDDFLKFDIQKYNPPVTIIGNFPYNISSQIIFKIIENKKFVSEMCGMFQLEVAKRICEKSGTKVYGILSVLTQAFFETTFLFTVSKNLFYPVPNVESAVISLKRKENFHLECNELLFFRVVKLSFQQRRKKIRNGLKTLNLSNNLREDAIFDKRPEQLSVDQFIDLTNLINQDLKHET